MPLNLLPNMVALTSQDIKGSWVKRSVSLLCKECCIYWSCRHRTHSDLCSVEAEMRQEDSDPRKYCSYQPQILSNNNIWLGSAQLKHYFYVCSVWSRNSIFLKIKMILINAFLSVLEVINTHDNEDLEQKTQIFITSRTIHSNLRFSYYDQLGKVLSSYKKLLK